MVDDQRATQTANPLKEGKEKEKNYIKRKKK
jgi:hypothetical protein